MLRNIYGWCCLVQNITVNSPSLCCLLGHPVWSWKKIPSWSTWFTYHNIYNPIYLRRWHTFNISKQSKISQTNSYRLQWSEWSYSTLLYKTIPILSPKLMIQWWWYNPYTFLLRQKFRDCFVFTAFLKVMTVNSNLSRTTFLQKWATFFCKEKMF